AFRLSTRLATPSGPNAISIASDYLNLTGAVGTAMSDLRPAGVARFGDDRVDVVSEGDFIPAGSTIRVLRTAGNRVTVRVEEPASPGSDHSETTASQTAASGTTDASPDATAVDGREERS